MTALRRFRTRRADQGSVSPMMLVITLGVLIAVLAITLFAQASDTRGKAQKAADAAALAAADPVREAWIRAWLSGLDAPLPDPPSPTTPPPTGDPSPSTSPTPSPSPTPPPFEVPLPQDAGVWGQAAWVGLTSAQQYAARNDGATVTGYRAPRQQITVDVLSATTEVETEPAREIQESLQAPASATARVNSPRGLSCVPLDVTQAGYTLRCTSREGSATARYNNPAYHIPIIANMAAWERMFPIRLVD